MKLLVDHHGSEARAAVIDENGALQTLSIETLDKKQTKGNIYLARITRIEPGIGAVFLDYGGKKHGFLPFVQLQKLVPHAQNIIKETAGQTILVQVIKEERAGKGCSFTTEISLAGLYCVLLPYENSIGGISRKIKGSIERDRLKKVVDSIKLPEYIGLLVRTSAENIPAPELRRDVRYLHKLWTGILKKAESQKAPALMYEEYNVFEKAVRDVTQKNLENIFVEGPEAFKEVKEFIKNVIPSYKSKLKEHRSNTDSLFNIYNINQQIEDLISPVVRLKSGGSLVIQHTEALISIDVNSAGYKTQNQAETVRHINLEACLEIARQIFLRDISGIIVIDFIDMETEEDQQLIQKTLKAQFKLDKARTTFETINRFGVLLMTRQRTKKQLSDYFMQKCPCCLGYGLTRTPESMSMSILRHLEKKASENSRSTLHLKVSKEIYDYLQNNLRSFLHNIESTFQVRVMITSVWHLTTTEYHLQIGGQKCF